MNEDFISAMESSESNSDRATAYVEMMTNVIKSLDKLEPKTEAKKIQVEIYKCLAQRTIDYCIYIKTLDSDFNFMQIVM